MSPRKAKADSPKKVKPSKEAASPAARVTRSGGINKSAAPESQTRASRAPAPVVMAAAFREFKTIQLWTEPLSLYVHTVVYAIDHDWQPFHGIVVEKCFPGRTQTTDCQNIVDDVEQNTLRPFLKAIPKSTVYAKYPENFLQANDNELDSCFLKYPPLHTYMPVKDLTEEPPSEISQALLVEARIYESFRDLPHPHILQYKGCVVRDGRIVALALPKLPETLGARIEDETRPIDGVKVYEEVSAGLRYLHSLGLAHNDIAPSNIMLREDDTAVIIDFGSCAKEGEATSGTVSVGWSLNGPKSEKRKDKHALEVLKKYLEDPLHRDPFHQYEEI